MFLAIPLVKVSDMVASSCWRGQFKKGAIETCLIAIKKNLNTVLGLSLPIREPVLQAQATRQSRIGWASGASGGLKPTLGFHGRRAPGSAHKRAHVGRLRPRTRTTKRSPASWLLRRWSKAAEASSTGSAATAHKQSPPAWLKIVGALLSGVGASLLAIRAR